MLKFYWQEQESVSNNIVNYSFKFAFDGQLSQGSFDGNFPKACNTDKSIIQGILNNLPRILAQFIVSCNEP
jgi:hypothetical protein